MQVDRDKSVQRKRPQLRETAKRLAAFVVWTTVASVGLFVPVPAPAHDEVCAAEGTVILSNGFGLPGIAALTSASFLFGIELGACTTSASLTASGFVTGWCGLSSGRGVTNHGHYFAFTSTGTAIVVTGDVTAIGVIQEDVFDAGACINQTAVRFIVTFGALQTHGLTPTLAPCTEEPVQKDAC